MTASSIFQRGAGVALVERFFTQDPVTKVSTPVDPATITLEVRDPESVVTTFTFGVGTVITKSAVGVYVAKLNPLLPVGDYAYVWIGTTPALSDQGTFAVIENPVLAPAQPHVPVLGPYSTWITGEDVATCTGIVYGNNPAVFDTVAVEASMALYEISGRRFPGLQVRTVRPCRNNCGCWLSGPISSGFWPVWWTGSPWGTGGGWGWYNEVGDRFGCEPMSRVRLAGYPVREILQVKIDGTVLPEFDVASGSRNWRLDHWRELIRMDAPADPITGAPSETRFWPGCQSMSLDDDQPGTFSIKYRWGTEVPQLGKEAAKEIANQLYLACGGSPCTVPAGVTRLVRENVTIERGLLANWLDPKKPTGLVNLDLFLQAYTNGQRGGRRSMLWSPDLQQFARKVGTQGG